MLASAADSPGGANRVEDSENDMLNGRGGSSGGTSGATTDSTGGGN